MSQLDRLKARLSPTELSTFEDTKLNEILLNAKDIILERRFPFAVTEAEYILEPQYMGLQLDIAMELISKLGIEGQVGHTENGVTRTFSSSTISKELLQRITPKGRVR